VRCHLYAPSSFTSRGYIKYCISYRIVTDMSVKPSRAPPENRTHVSEMSPLRPVLLYTTRLHQILHSNRIFTDMSVKTSRAPPENRTQVSEMSPLRPVLLYATRLHQILHYNRIFTDMSVKTSRAPPENRTHVSEIVTFTPRPPLHHAVTSNTACPTGSLQTCQ